MTPTTPRTTVVHVKQAPFDVYIGRAEPRSGLPKTKWANPYRLGLHGTRTDIAKYRDFLLRRGDLLAALPEIKGKVLGCWCFPRACHGDVLAELADALPAPDEP